MDSSALSLSSSISLRNLTSTRRIPCRLSFRGVNSCRISAVSDSPNGFLPLSSSEALNGYVQAKPNSSGDVHRRLSSLESLFCYDKAIPEEKIEKPVGVSMAEKVIGDNARCSDCQAKGVLLCTTCSGSGLYVDSILESQGIIVKVRCLGCGGSGNIMCLECGGRGHLNANDMENSAVFVQNLL